MGKKTNWTLSEDQALCRAWLCASDAALGHATGTDQKAGTFWGVVHQLFHAELETSVDRPVTGLKIRWTRINRDVQRFALAFARVQAADSITTEAATLDPETERRAVDTAAELFLKEQGAKFTFETCWRLLRFSPRWMQLLANAAGGSTTTISPSDAMPHASVLQKRRLGEIFERAPLPETATTYLAAIAHELSRQSDLMEEQNAIALFRMDLDMVDDDVARAYFTSLRATYAKRMRRTDDEDETVDDSSVNAKETADL